MEGSHAPSRIFNQNVQRQYPPFVPFAEQAIECTERILRAQLIM